MLRAPSASFSHRNSHQVRYDALSHPPEKKKGRPVAGSASLIGGSDQLGSAWIVCRTSCSISFPSFALSRNLVSTWWAGFQSAKCSVTV
jgi:hypothetical protein